MLVEYLYLLRSPTNAVSWAHPSRNTFRPSKGSQLDKPQTTLGMLDRCGLVVTDNAWFIMWELGYTNHDDEESYVLCNSVGIGRIGEHRSLASIN